MRSECTRVDYMSGQIKIRAVFCYVEWRVSEARGSYWLYFIRMHLYRFFFFRSLDNTRRKILYGSLPGQLSNTWNSPTSI